MNDAALYALLYVLMASLAGAAFGVVLFLRREAPPMAVYEVSRIDAAGPGEFVSATVIASGTAQAREAVAHMTGVVAKGRGRNVKAERVETAGTRVHVLAAYFDESPTLDDALSADEYAGDVSNSASFNF